MSRGVYNHVNIYDYHAITDLNFLFFQTTKTQEVPARKSATLRLTTLSQPRLTIVKAKCPSLDTSWPWQTPA